MWIFSTPRNAEDAERAEFLDKIPCGLSGYCELCVKPERQEHTVVFLQNFYDELRRRVPTSR